MISGLADVILRARMGEQGGERISGRVGPSVYPLPGDPAKVKAKAELLQVLSSLCYFINSVVSIQLFHALACHTIKSDMPCDPPQHLNQPLTCYKYRARMQRMGYCGEKEASGLALTP